MNKKFYWFCFAILFFLAVFLRFYQLGKVPPGIMVDESIIGYDAYSVYKTGKDVWGKKWPLIFKSFGDYKPPGLEYTITFLLNFLSLNTFTTRLPSAVGGLLAALGIYLIIRQLFPKKYYLAGIGTIIFLFSPWSFQLSRLYFESNLALGFFTLGIAFLTSYLRIFLFTKKLSFNSTLLAGLIILAFSGYFYVAHRALATFAFLTFLLFIFIKSKNKFSKCFLAKLAILSGIFFLVAAPMLWQFLTPRGRIRLSQQGSLMKFGHELIINSNRKGCYLSSGKKLLLTKICYFFWNKPILKISDYIKFYLEHFSFNFLFFSGSQYKNISMPGRGGLPIVLIPFFILGLVVFFKKALYEKRFEYAFLLAILVASPIPASLADVPTEQRSNPLLPFLIIAITLGVDFALSILKKKKVKALFLMIIVFLWMFTTGKYLINYFWLYTQKSDILWRKALPETVKIVDNLNKKNNYEKIIVNDIYGKDFLIALAFYRQIDPIVFQREAVWVKTDQSGTLIPKKFANIYVGGENLDSLVLNYKSNNKKNILYVSRPSEKYRKCADYVIYDRNKIHQLITFYDINNSIECLIKKGNFTEDK